MKDFASYLRVIVITALVALLAEYLIDSGDMPAFMVYPEVMIFVGLFALTLIAIEIMVTAMNRVSQALMSEEQKRIWEEKQALAQENAWYKRLYRGLTKTKPIEEEGEIILDHNYDGIQELDNSLPPWWLYGFYLTILFGAIYLVRYHIMGADSQAMEYENEMMAARAAVEEYKRTAKDLIDVNSVELLTDAADLAKGKAAFETNCIACHMQDGGGGIGPNLTDAHWILGGGIKNVFRTISEGGRDGKGMIAWKTVLKPAEIAQVASYVLSLQGSTPANPKDAEGDLWQDEGVQTPNSNDSVSPQVKEADSIITAP